MTETVCRTFANEPTELRSMTSWFRDVLAGASVNEELKWKAEVCLNEATTNIITHAYDDGVGHPISIEIQLAARDVRITIVDDGRPFNPLDAPPPVRAHSLEDAPVGGLGIDLIKAYAQNVTYRRELRRNVLVLTFAGRD